MKRMLSTSARVEGVRRDLPPLLMAVPPTYSKKPEVVPGNVFEHEVHRVQTTKAKYKSIELADEIFMKYWSLDMRKVIHELPFRERQDLLGKYRQNMVALLKGGEDRYHFYFNSIMMNYSYPEAKKKLSYHRWRRNMILDQYYRFYKAPFRIVDVAPASLYLPLKVLLTQLTWHNNKKDEMDESAADFFGPLIKSEAEKAGRPMPEAPPQSEGEEGASKPKTGPPAHTPAEMRDFRRRFSRKKPIPLVENDEVNKALLMGLGRVFKQVLGPLAKLHRMETAAGTTSLKQKSDLDVHQPESMSPGWNQQINPSVSWQEQWRQKSPLNEEEWREVEEEFRSLGHLEEGGAEGGAGIVGLERILQGGLAATLPSPVRTKNSAQLQRLGDSISDELLSNGEAHGVDTEPLFAPHSAFASTHLTDRKLLGRTVKAQKEVEKLAGDLATVRYQQARRSLEDLAFTPGTWLQYHSATWRWANLTSESRRWSRLGLGQGQGRYAATLPHEWVFQREMHSTTLSDPHLF